MSDVITANRLTDGVVVFQTARRLERGFQPSRRAGRSGCDGRRARASQARRSRQSRRRRPTRSRSRSATAISRPRPCARRSAPRGRRTGAISASRRWGSRRTPVLRPRRRPIMYRYDDFDAAFVAARVEQFRDQVARRLAGELTEEQFRPHRLMNGLYLQLHAYMLRIAVPYGIAEFAPDAQARRDRAQLRSRLRPFHHPPEHPVQLAGAQGHARHPGRARQRRDARDPDLGQLHPQRHRRSLRRRRARRNRRSAPLCRDPAAMVVAPSGVLVPAAQVQDRRQRRGA